MGCRSRPGSPPVGPVALAVAALTLALAPEAAIAASFFDVPGYVGGGFQYGTVASGNPSISGSRGPGFEVVFGRRLRDRFPLYFDLRFGSVFVDVGPTPEIAFPADHADYAMMAVGGLWDFRSAGGRRTGPWVSLHGTYHNFNWKQYSYSIEGLGFSPGAGMNVHLPGLGLLRVGVTGSFFHAKSSYQANASGQTFLVSMGYLYPFGPR